MQKYKKPISILLAILMVFSVFAIVPATAGAAEDTYTVAGSSGDIFGHEWNETDTANDMTLVDGVYTITYKDVQPANDIELKVVKNHNWEAGSYPNENYKFSVETVSDVTVTFDPATETVNVTGDGVTQDFDVYSVIAVGNGEDGDAYLNGADWDPCDQSNALTQVSDGIWEMTMEDIYAWDNYNIKFVVNSVDADGNPTSNPWAHSFGSEVEQLYPTGEALDAVYNGKNCIFEVEEDGSTVKLQLDLRNFDFKTKQGAKMTITVSDDEPVQPTTEPAPIDHTYTVAGSIIFGHEWNETDTANDMTLVDGVYTITYKDVQPANGIEFKVVKNHNWEAGSYPNENYKFSVETVSDVTVTFDPATETVNVTGDGVTQDFDVYSVIAVGNGEETYLNGANWDPCDPANAMRKVADGIWEMTMEDIYAFDNYNIRFAVNSIDAQGNPTSNPWAYYFGSEVEQLYPTGEALDAVYNGKNCIFEVEEDGSTVKLQLDLRNFDFKTKQGAKMTITVSDDEPEPTGYYIVGTMTDWGINPYYKLTANEATEGEYMFLGLNLTADSDQFKIGYSEDGETITTWYPDGVDTNYGYHGEITANGTYDVYFRPDGQGGENWFHNYFYVTAQGEPEQPTTEEPTTVEPTTAESTTAPVEPTTEPVVNDIYTVAGSSADMFGTTWDSTNTANDMTLGEGGVYSIVYTDVQPEDAVQLKVVKNHSWDEAWGDKETDDNYIFNVVEACDVTVTFDPATETVNVTGDGVTQGFDVYSVIAVGNGEDGDAYLNGADWDPCDQSNALTQVADGIWEMTMEDIYAWDNYNIKFVVNSVDADGNPTSNPWAHSFGSEVEQLYPTGEELDAVYNGKNCIFEVEEDESIVKFQLDLRNFDFKTKSGAKMTITVTAPEPEQPTTVEPTTVEPTTVAPTTAESTTAPHEYDGDGQRVYFRFPDESVWTHEGLKIAARTGKANVYCYAYAIYGNSHKYSLGWKTRATQCDAEAEGGAITDATLFSFDLASQQDGIEEGADYGIIFSTAAAGQNQTCDLNLSTECIGDTVIVTPFNGQVDRENAADSNKRDHYAAWQNHTDPYGPKATISSIGALMPGYFPANQPHAQQLSTAFKQYLTDLISNPYFQYDNNMVLCDALQTTPEAVYAQYLADNEDIIAAGMEQFGPDGELEDTVPCPFYRYMGENDQGQMVEKKLATPAYVRDVLGLSDEPATEEPTTEEPTTEEPTTEEPTTAEPTEEPEVLNGPQADGSFYINGERQKAYQLCEYEGDWYFVAENHKIAKDQTRYLNATVVEGTDFAVGYYQFDDEGKLVDKNGPDENDFFYINGVKQNAYKLCEYEGNYYFVAEYNKIAKDRTRYLNADAVDGTDFTAGYYDFDGNGKMIIKNGPSDDGYFYKNGVKQNAYQLINFDGDYYFVAEYNKIAKDQRRYLNAAVCEGTPFTKGYYEFNADGKMIIPD